MVKLTANSYKLKARVIGIDASRAFLKRRTGIEEYAYQTIKHLRDELSSDEEVVLYVRKKLEIRNWKLEIRTPEIDFELPRNWVVRALWAPRFWTQIALSLEMFWHTPDVLFVPAHTVPIIHPKKTVVTIHGLEYEYCKTAYSFWERVYMHYSIMLSCQVASTVICVSENTKKDVMKLYGVPEEKIRVIYEGFDEKFQLRSKNFESNSNIEISKFLLFIGRLEERKNVVRMIEAFEILKEKYNIPHELVLVGKPGYGYGRIQYHVSRSKYKDAIIEKGYVDEIEKWELLKNADVFLFPTLYEGFGIPILEAQSVGVPVVTSDTSSLPEVAGEGAIFVHPESVESISEGVYRVLSDQALRSGIIEKAVHNVNRYSWASCAREIMTAVTT
jgi:glycosyltransferase involved in cell wall biosynthesis